MIGEKAALNVTLPDWAQSPVKFHRHGRRAAWRFRVGDIKAAIKIIKEARDAGLVGGTNG